jgi:hypothetical protein
MITSYAGHAYHLLTKELRGPYDDEPFKKDEVQETRYGYNCALISIL